MSKLKLMTLEKYPGYLLFSSWSFAFISLQRAYLSQEVFAESDFARYLSQEKKDFANNFIYGFLYLSQEDAVSCKILIPSQSNSSSDEFDYLFTK